MRKGTVKRQGKGSRVVTRFAMFLAIFLLAVCGMAMAGPVPDTGQTKCYDDAGNEIPCPQPVELFYGQDAQYNINPQFYTKLDANGNDLSDSATEWMMVRDNVTGLIWEIKQAKDGKRDYSNPHDADNTYTWYDSNPETNGGDAGTAGDGTDTEDFINALNSENFGGYSDWRMPTIKELASIVNSGTYYPAINTAYFPDTMSSSYPSSTTYVSLTHLACNVSFGNGKIYSKYKSRSYYVRAVRAGQSGSFNDLVINDDSTVTDISTGLMWKQETAGAMNWEDALAYCENLSLAGYTDWRLPDRNELQSLVDYDRYRLSIDTAYFPDTMSSFYWSSTTHVRNTNDAWYVYFSDGRISSNGKSHSFYVRAVRGGQAGSFDNLVISAPLESDRTGAAPHHVNFHVTGISAQYYEWDFDSDGNIDATTYDNRISHTFMYEGNYTVKIAAIDFNGVRYEKEIVITVLPSDEINKDITFIPFHPSSDSISSEVMKGGKAVRYYRVLDHNGVSVKEKTIYYSFNGGWPLLTGDIDDQGFLNIITPAVTTDTDYFLTVTDKNGTILATAVNNPPAFSVHVTDREFTENYKILFGTGGSLGIGGPGGKIGPLKLKTIGAGLNGGKNIGSSIVLCTTGINTDLKVENSLGHEFGIEASAGLFGKTWGVKTRPSINAGVEIEANIGSSLSAKYDFPNFFNKNQFDHDDQLLASAALFLENALNSSRNSHRLGIDQIIKDRIISEIVERISNLSAYEQGIGNTVFLGGKGALGVDFELKNPLGISAGSLLNINLSAFDGEYIYERTGEEDLDGAKKTTQAVTHNLDIGSFKASIVQKFWGDKRRNDTPKANLGNLADYTALKIEGEESISLETDPNGNIFLDFQYLDERTGGDSILSYKINNSETINELANRSGLVWNMLYGHDAVLNPASYQKAHESIIDITHGQVEWEEIKKDIKLVSIPFDIEIGAGIKFGIHLNLDVVSSIEYIGEKGFISPEKGWITTQIYEKDGYITNHLKGPESVISEYVKALKTIVSDIFDTVIGVVEAGKELIVSTAETVGEAGAQLKAGADFIISGAKLHISNLPYFRGTYNTRTISKRTAYSKALEESIALTIGNVFIVNVTDENNNPISEFTTPLELAIDYTETMLQEAGFSLEKESRLRIYRWDGESGCYQFTGGTVDTANKKVIASITLPGQYILAIDELVPEVSAFKVSDGTPEPAITFAVNDTISEIDPALFSLKIDGIEVVNSTNYNDYLNVSTGLFTYQVDNELSPGEHTAAIQTGDSAGNAKEYIYTFTVNNTPPTIDHTPITETTAQAPLLITATVTDDKGILGVFLHYRGKTNEMPYIIAEMTKSEDSAEYTAAIPEEYLTSFGARYYIKAIDITGNETESDPVDVSVEDNTGPKISGDITITPDPDGFIVRWEVADAIDTLGYMVYLGKTIDTLEPYKDTASSTWILITGLEDNCYVTVSGYDATGNKGDLLGPVKIQLHIPGDVNNDRRIDLADVILALQVSVSMTPLPVICKKADINGDGKIGVEEAVYGLQWVAGLRPQTIEQIETLQSTKSRTLSPDVAETELNELVAGNNTFALNLYHAIRTNTGNLFYSPYSISSAIAMTYSGARNETELQMANTLNFTLPQNRLHPAFNALDLELAARGVGAEGQDGEGFRLNIANSIWGQKGYSFLPEFLDVLAENYGAGLSLLDFYNAPEDSRVIINTWVSEQTEDKINDLIPQGAIFYLTRLVLTNAIYFNAAWNLPFDEKLTMDGPFYLPDGSQITAPMMSQTGYFGYTEGYGYQAVELLYDGEELSMVVLCPEAGGFEEFENTITPDRLNAIVNDLSSVNVQLKLPKFTYESGSISLKKALTQMGMPVPFSSSADFSGINGTRNLFISDIFHKAFVSVDEAGTEAAAATAVIVKVIAIPTPPVEVTIDRPFIFLIRDIKTQAILFVGSIVNPAE